MAICLSTRLQSIIKIRILPKLQTPIVPRLSIRCFSLQSKSAQFLNPVKCNLIFTRTLFLKFFLKPSPEKLRVADGIPEYYRLIYRNTMHRYLLSAQIFSSVSALIVCFVAFIYNKEEFYKLDPQQWRTDDQPKPIENEGLIYVTTFVTLCVILQLMVSRMPIRIYNLPEKEKYIFVFYGSLPMTKRRLVCKVRDITKVEEAGLLPWKDNRYDIRNKRRIIMLENFFRKPADLNIMLGYQKAPENYD